jgi:hypothetical protein
VAYSLPDLVSAVLEDLGVLEAGQPVSAEDSQTVLNRLPAKLAELNARDVGYIDPTNLDDAVFLPLVKIMAHECRAAFDITDATTVALLAADGAPRGTAEQAIKDVLRLRTPRQTMRCEMFGRRRWRGGW